LSTRAKQICLLILAQTLCVGVGLWMQHRYVASTLRHALDEDAWCRIELAAKQIGNRVDGLPIGAAAPDSAEHQQARLLLERARPNSAGVLILDGQRRALVHLPASAPTETPPLTPGKPVSWEPSLEPSQRGSDLVRGSLELADGSHIAACRALSAGRGYVLVYHPVAALESQLAALTRSLPSAAWVALFWTVAVLTIVGFVILGQIHEGAERQQTRATSDVLRQAQDLVRTRDAVIFGLAKLAESRDDDTGEHLERISAYTTMLAVALRRHSTYADEVTPSFIRLIGISAALHDIGKVGIEDRILLKRGPLSAAERAQMQKHTLIGAECLQGIEQRLGTSNFLQMARKIVLAHHERWDGKGYPKGLARDAIPLAARVVAIADTYDALSSKRVYKAALPHEECVAIIGREAGKQFDPHLIEVWLTLESKFRDVARSYATSAPVSDEVGARDSAPLRPGEHDDQAPLPSVPLPEGATEACPELASLR